MTASRRQPDSRAERLGTALQSLAAELVQERQKARQLRKENAELRAQLERPAEARRGR